MHPILAKAALALACISPLTLGACTTTGFGYGSAGIYDDGYSYGYGQPEYGYGLGGFGGGWYDDFYYPGTGVYVIDRGGRRHRWNDDQRRYWQNRPQAGRPGPGQPDGIRPGSGRPDGVRPGFGRPRPDGQESGASGVRPQEAGPRPSWGQGRPGRQGFGGTRPGGRGFGGRGGPRTPPQPATPHP